MATHTQGHSDYGQVSAQYCDPHLRSRVAAHIKNARENNVNVSAEDLCEVATYINQLEDALLQHHAGRLASDQVLIHLKKCVGLDISTQAYTLEMMHSEDA